jgi:ABC-type dipeptide/oligopeptide/nickel transport system permease component
MSVPVYILRRVLQALPLLVIISIISFTMLKIAPVDPLAQQIEKQKRATWHRPGTRPQKQDSNSPTDITVRKNFECLYKISIDCRQTIALVHSLRPDRHLKSDPSRC